MVVRDFQADGGTLLPPHTRIAIPDDGPGYSVAEVAVDSFPEFFSLVSSLIIDALRAHDVAVPMVGLREILDNLVHAVPCTASVVVSPSFRNIYISDTGPGIARTDLAFQLGYSTASILQRSYIRGVGLGLFLARREAQSLGGDLLLESSPGLGTYVNFSLPGSTSGDGWQGDGPCLTQRQNNILFLLSEGESMGPSAVAGELNIAVSTAYRDLTKLQRLGLVFLADNGKRFLSESGRSYLQGLLSL